MNERCGCRRHMLDTHTHTHTHTAARPQTVRGPHTTDPRSSSSRATDFKLNESGDMPTRTPATVSKRPAAPPPTDDYMHQLTPADHSPTYTASHIFRSTFPYAVLCKRTIARCAIAQLPGTGRTCMRPVHKFSSFAVGNPAYGVGPLCSFTIHGTRTYVRPTPSNS